jgi:hypothetical protein
MLRGGQNQNTKRQQVECVRAKTGSDVSITGMAIFYRTVSVTETDELDQKHTGDIAGAVKDRLGVNRRSDLTTIKVA